MGSAAACATIGGPLGAATPQSLPSLPTPDITLPISGDGRSHRQQLVDTIADGSKGVIAINGTLDLGSTNLTAGSFTDSTVTIARSVTFVPAAGYGSLTANPYGDGEIYDRRFTRTATIIGWLKFTAGSAKMYGIKRRIATFPAVATQGSYTNWNAVGVVDFYYMDAVEGTADFESWGCEHVVGYGGDETPLDPEAVGRLPDMKTPASWKFTASYASIVDASDGSGIAPAFPGWGDSDWVSYNRLLRMPQGVGGSSTWTGAYIKVRHGYFHDISTGIACQARGTGGANQMVEIGDCEFARCYVDAYQLSTNKGARFVARSFRNIVHQVVGNAKDSMNPHTDAFQLYGFENGGTGGSGNGVYPIAHMRNWANVFIAKHTNRANFQGYFLQTTADHYQGTGTEASKQRFKLVGSETHESLILNANKAFMTEGQQGTLVRNLIGVSQQTLSFADAATVKAGTLNIQRGNSNLGDSEIPDTASFIENVIVDSIGRETNGYSSTSTVTNSRQLGTTFDSTRASAMAAAFTNLDQILSSPALAFAAAARTAGAASQGLTQSSLKDLLTMAEPDIPRVGFVPALNAAISTVTASSLAYVHGIVGTSRTVVPGSGVEWRVLDPWSEAQVAGWSSSSGTIQSGQLLQVRATSAATAVTAANYTITVAGISVPFQIITASSATYPTATFSAARIEATAATGLTGVASTVRKLSFFADFITSSDGSTTTQQMVHPGSGVKIIIGTINGAFRVLIRANGGANTALSLQSSAGTFANSTRYRVHFTLDLDAGATFSECVQLYVNDVKAGSFVAQTLNNAYSIETNDKWRVGSTSAGAQPLKGQLGRLAVWMDVAVDWSSVQNRLNTAPEIFTAGTEVTGALPHVLMKGNAATLNSTNGANEGSGGAFDNLGTDVT